LGSEHSGVAGAGRQESAAIAAPTTSLCPRAACDRMHFSRTFASAAREGARSAGVAESTVPSGDWQDVGARPRIDERHAPRRPWIYPPRLPASDRV